VEPSAFTKTSALGIEEQRVNVILDLDDPREAWSALGDGYRVEAKVVVERKTDVLLAPAGALFRQEDRWSAFVDHEGVAELRTVEVGSTDGRVTEVRSGLSSGERVVLHPTERIGPGVRLRAR
jgi:HlyD family secretion protein